MWRPLIENHNHSNADLWSLVQVGHLQNNSSPDGKIVKNQKIREFVVRLYLFVMSEGIPIESHQHGNFNIN